MRIRRAVTTAFIAGALALVPSAAFGYGAGDYTNLGTASTTTPTLGVPFTITVVGPSNTPVVLTITSNPASIPDSAITIAGTRALTKNTDATGTAVFTVTLSQAGTYTAVVSDGVSGDVLSTQTFTVVAPAAPSASPTATAAGGGSLSATGVDGLPLALGAGALLAAGAGVVVYANKRRQDTRA